ncbi:PepSY domain-containing protein [Phormidium sp. LEGE 05292]|uniref:PepSY-associated TM helix domain-containing protein n=1 Tax=[Phormidium] sp. LEGE 05292 TaxID=767427 RepID=UPI00188285FE|nr:PepSY domain-containing protein [Phormidium sp. LEGE 05292]MBE9224944.1 PepSY domain-containing protein [Phormidium sp. LEGE 05292]
MSKINAALNSSQVAEPPSNRFYRTVWRWHFYAGLFVIPFMVILSITGIIYLFKPQLDAAMYHDRMFVKPADVAMPYTQQVAVVQRTYPDAKVTKFTPSVAANRSAEVTISTKDERTLAIFVNPYTAKILGQRDENNNLQAIARKIHGELAIGNLGDYLVELAACWGLVLLISGLYLWLPRHRVTFLGTLIPRLWSHNRRVFWRDLHAVSGFYGILLIGFLIVTGLPWTGFWGHTFARLTSYYPAQMWDNVPKSTVLTGSLNQQGNQVVPWAVEQLPMPKSSTHEHEHNTGNHETSAKRIPADKSVNLDTVVALAKAKGAPPGFSVSFPESETGVYTVSAFPDDPTQEVTMHIDRYSGAVLADVRWKDYGLVPKAVEMGISIHIGKYFGLSNQLLMLIASLILIVLSVSGGVMWWQRRPFRTGWLGAPTMPAHVQQSIVPLTIVAVLGIVFPLVGLSLIIVLLLDYLVLARIPALKRIFN